MTNSYTKYKSRIRYVSVFIILFWFTLCAKLFSVQVFNGQKHKKVLIAQSQRKEIILPERGNIFDRNNDALTRNISHYSLSVNPQNIINKKSLAIALSNITSKTKEHFLKRLNSKKKFEFLFRNIRISQSDVDILKTFSGLTISKKYHRFYPHGLIASQILGYTDSDDNGISGLEKDYDNFLSGTAGKAIKSKGWKGKFQNRSDLPYMAPLNGNNIELTLDLNYQSILQQELEKRLKETRAKSAMGVIMNPQTGAILAMASVPSFDNNNFSKYPIDNHRCRVITDQFEPGSTFKIVAATAALSEKKVDLSEEFNCENGQFDYFGTSIKDHEPHEFLNTSQIIQNSSNIGIIKIAEKVGSRSMYKYTRLFGFGSTTNMGLDGETPGKVKPEKEWSRISTGQISMGHEVAVNTLQLATAFSAIANDGYIVKPHIVKRIYGQDEKTKFHNLTKVKRKISTEDIVLEVKNMLRKVVVSGTGTEADIPGWEVAGKTGTAQKYIDGKYSNNHFISNFVGFLPSSNPKLLSAIVLDEPESPMHWGGQGAAVAFRRIMQRIINMDDTITPPLKNRKSVKPKFLVSKTIKNKGHIQSPPVSLSTINIKKRIKVPNVIGKSLKSAIKHISRVGLRVKVIGSGQVVSQTPRAGKILKNNDVCTLSLK